MADRDNSSSEENYDEDEEDYSLVYGGIEGPDSVYIKLVSSCGHEFFVKREKALAASPILESMINGPFDCDPDEANEVILREVKSFALQLVCMFFSYKAFYGVSESIPDFPIPNEGIFDLMITSHFLGC